MHGWKQDLNSFPEIVCPKLRNIFEEEVSLKKTGGSRKLNIYDGATTSNGQLPPPFFSILIEITISWLWIKFKEVAILSHSLVTNDATHNLNF